MDPHLLIAILLFAAVFILKFIISKINANIELNRHLCFLNQNRGLLESVTTINRGTNSERNTIVKLLKNKIHPKTIFHDLYIAKGNGKFSQIDIVVATSSGIVVIEVKEYSGWIFGKGYNEQWTQVLSYGVKKFRFYNPILQNKRHIDELRKKSKQFENIPFYSVIVFDGSCQLRNISFIPEGTFVVRIERLMEVMKIIQEKEPASYSDKHEVISILKEGVDNGSNTFIEKLHSEHVKTMLGKHRLFD